MIRISSHLIEDKATNYVKMKIIDYFENGDAIYRDLSGRDYGIDGLVELFDNGNTTGKISFIQVKGTHANIERTLLSHAQSAFRMLIMRHKISYMFS